jgi:hypothetical protein
LWIAELFCEFGVNNYLIEKSLYFYTVSAMISHVNSLSHQYERATVLGKVASSLAGTTGQTLLHQGWANSGTGMEERGGSGGLDRKFGHKKTQDVPIKERSWVFQ